MNEQNWFENSFCYESYQDGIADYNLGKKKQDNPYAGVKADSWAQGWAEANYHADGEKISRAVDEQIRQYIEEHQEWVASFTADPAKWQDDDICDEQCNHEWTGGTEAQEDEDGVYFERRCVKCESQQVQRVHNYPQPNL